MWSRSLPTHCQRAATTLTSSSKLHDPSWMWRGNSYHRPYSLSWEFRPNFQSVCQKELLPFQYPSDINWKKQLGIQCPGKVDLAIKKVGTESRRGRFDLFFRWENMCNHMFIWGAQSVVKFPPSLQKELEYILLEYYDTFHLHPCCQNMPVFSIHYYCCPEFYSAASAVNRHRGILEHIFRPTLIIQCYLSKSNRQNKASPYPWYSCNCSL